MGEQPQQAQQEYIRPEVMAFAHAMETTLRKHDHKGGWDEEGVGYLLDGVEREYKEAREAWNAVKKQKDYYRVSEELIDVANFCMMFWERMEVTKVKSLLDIYSHPHTTALEQTIPLKKFVLHLSRINSELNNVWGKINRFDDTMDSDKMTSEEYDDLANLKGWRDALNWALIPDGPILTEHDAIIAAQAREKVLGEIKESLMTCSFYDEMISGEGGCLGQRNGEPSCDGCSYFEIDGNQIKNTIQSLRNPPTPKEHP